MPARKQQAQSAATAARKTPSANAVHSGSGRLSGKVAVVTGGNRGIGLAIARALVGEGCHVVVTGRDRPALAKAKEELDSIATKLNRRPEVLTERCEVQKPDSVTTLFATVKKRWGRLDVLVNNAGISQAMVPVEETSVELWRSVLDTN